ncbi:Gfo/Idh/MocA family protein [Marinoscillum furvescens]|uniref:Putative dehydrogenase n=1 Tax=Marinoscillum furvescens DSM 4134 TaxID=1122208 RepID=A0A3D9L7A9_MARFU|nr:Gfo/Idh/MocA family oxidoreductase [Marinoscillum furvescens]REE01190.1 putative dehydrogenase [Marinoscillum furvescens DSM 4134]
MKKKLKGVCVGVGYFAQFHYEAWARIPEVEILALCDLRLEEATEVARKWEIGVVYTDFEKMLDEQKPDFIDIITPPQTHLDIVKAAAKRGVNIICQKPLAPSLEEARGLVETAEKHNVRLMIHENWRFQPWYRQIKSLLDTNEIGEQLFYAYFRMRMGDGWQSDAYMDRQPYFRDMPRLLIYETGIHFIDTFRYLFGEVVEVYAKLRRYNSEIKGEDAALVQLTFESGQMVCLDANRYNESNVTNSRYTFGELLIEGSEGSIRLQGDGGITVQPLGLPERAVSYEPSKHSFAGDCVYQTQLHFVRSMLLDQPFETNGAWYLRNIEVQEAIYESGASGLPVSV